MHAIGFAEEGEEMIPVADQVNTQLVGLDPLAALDFIGSVLGAKLHGNANRSRHEFLLRQYLARVGATMTNVASRGFVPGRGRAGASGGD
jgi:hypothetical protein